jgi:hypothetical protein
VFFGSSQTEHWLPRYGHFKFRGIGGVPELSLLVIYSCFTCMVRACKLCVNSVKRRKIEVCKLCVNFIFLIGVNFDQTLCKLFMITEVQSHKF